MRECHRFARNCLARGDFGYPVSFCAAIALPDFTQAVQVGLTQEPHHPAPLPTALNETPSSWLLLATFAAIVAYLGYLAGTGMMW